MLFLSFSGTEVAVRTDTARRPRQIHVSGLQRDRNYRADSRARRQMYVIMIYVYVEFLTRGLRTLEEMNY